MEACAFFRGSIASLSLVHFLQFPLSHFTPGALPEASGASFPEVFMDFRHNHRHSSVGAILLKAAFMLVAAGVKKVIENNSTPKPPEGGASAVKPEAPKTGGPR